MSPLLIFAVIEKKKAKLEQEEQERLAAAAAIREGSVSSDPASPDSLSSPGKL